MYTDTKSIVFPGCLVVNCFAQVNRAIRKMLSTFKGIWALFKRQRKWVKLSVLSEKASLIFLVVSINLKRADLPIKWHFTSWSIWCHSHWIKSNWNVIPFPEQIPLQGLTAQKCLTLCWLPRGLSRKLEIQVESAELMPCWTQPSHLTSRLYCCILLGQQRCPGSFCWPLQGHGQVPEGGLIPQKVSWHIQTSKIVTAGELLIYRETCTN